MASQPGGPDRRIDIRVLAPVEVDVAADILAEAMRDNPVHVRAFGSNPLRRQRRLRRFLGQMVAHVQAEGVLLGADVQGRVVGVLGMMEPGRCRPGRPHLLRLVSEILRSNPPIGVWRIQRWLAAWARNDPAEPHWHMGPLGVRPQHRRQGIGRRLMVQGCRHVEAHAGTAWLETDLAINVAFYETLGFAVARQERVLGVPNWFMRRPALGHAGAAALPS